MGILYRPLPFLPAHFWQPRPYWLGWKGYQKIRLFILITKMYIWPLVKSTPKKSFAQKTVFVALFTKVIRIFFQSVRKDGFFYAPFDLFKEKKFSSLRRDNELKRSKMEKTAQYLEKNGFLWTDLRFYLPSKTLCHTSKLWNFVKITGPYYIHKVIVYCCSLPTLPTYMLYIPGCDVC